MRESANNAMRSSTQRCSRCHQCNGSGTLACFMACTRSTHSTQAHTLWRKTQTMRKCWNPLFGYIFNWKMAPSSTRKCQMCKRHILLLNIGAYCVSIKNRINRRTGGDSDIVNQHTFNAKWMDYTNFGSVPDSCQYATNTKERQLCWLVQRRTKIANALSANWVRVCYYGTMALL